MSKKNSPKILVYDIETTPLMAYVWGLGKQVVRHGQLHKERNMYDIICITYQWLGDKKARALVFDENQDSTHMIEQFDKMAEAADVTIGKNSDRFDVKQINSQRMLKGLPPLGDWVEKAGQDDIEKQIRKYFYLPSYSLDYVSALMGFGGKHKMEFQDWIDIVEKNRGWKSKVHKMVEYGKKDVEDTTAVLKKILPYVKLKTSMTALNEGIATCNIPECGSTEMRKNGTRMINKTKYQRLQCGECGTHVGYWTIKKNGELGTKK